MGEQLAGVRVGGYGGDTVYFLDVWGADVEEE